MLPLPASTAPSPYTTRSRPLAMGDALAVACYEARGFTARDFARVHPAGRLGRRLIEVSELMHRGDDVPRVRTTASMSDTVKRSEEHTSELQSLRHLV